MKMVAAAEATGDRDLVAQGHYRGVWAGANRDPNPSALEELDAAQEVLREIGETHFSRGYWIAVTLRRSAGHHDKAVAGWRAAESETVCKRWNVMVWADGALIALDRGDLAAARAAVDRAWAYAIDVRDAGFIAYVHLTATEVAVFGGTPWPEAEVALDLAEGLTTGHPMVTAYNAEARGLAHFTAGALREADEDLARSITLLDGLWPMRTEARLRRVAIQQALGDVTQAVELLAELRSLADHCESGPWLVGQIDLRAAALSLDAGDSSDADELAHKALADVARGPWPPLVIVALELLSSIAVARESYTEAARLYGAAGAHRDTIEFRLETEPERSRLARDLAAARGAVGDADFDAAVEEGRALPLHDAVAYAQRARGERKRPLARLGRPHAFRTTSRGARGPGLVERGDRHSPLLRPRDREDAPVQRLRQGRRGEPDTTRRRRRSARHHLTNPHPHQGEDL